MAIDENLQSAASIPMPSVTLLQLGTYCLTFTEGDSDHIAILLGPLRDLLDMALFHLDAIVRRIKTRFSCKTHLLKVSDERKTRRTWQRNGMRGSAEHLVKEPENALKGFASILKSAQDNNCEDNGSERVDNVRLSDAITDDV